jgi:membrane protease YdiL (CAAX protease family)
MITLVTVIMYGRDFLRASPTLILIAIPAATINGLCEEILWRGLYVSLFPDNFWLAIAFPAIGFALWHLAPLQVISEGGKSAFVLSTFFLGLAYGWIALQTGSALWTALSHSLSGILALSGMIAPNVWKLLKLS